MFRTKLVLIPTFLLLAVVLTACSHDKSPETTPSPIPAATGNPTVGEKLETPLAQTTVTLKDYSYTPSDIEVKKGTSIKFTNLDKAGHTVTANDGSFDTPLFSDGESQVITFNQVGEYAYYCRPHTYMKGNVTVVE